MAVLNVIRNSFVRSKSSLLVSRSCEFLGSHQSGHSVNRFSGVRTCLRRFEGLARFWSFEADNSYVDGAGLFVRAVVKI